MKQRRNILPRKFPPTHRFRSPLIVHTDRVRLHGTYVLYRLGSLCFALDYLLDMGKGVRIPGGEEEGARLCFCVAKNERFAVAVHSYVVKGDVGGDGGERRAFFFTDLHTMLLGRRGRERGVFNALRGGGRGNK